MAACFTLGLGSRATSRSLALQAPTCHCVLSALHPHPSHPMFRVAPDSMSLSGHLKTQADWREAAVGQLPSRPGEPLEEGVVLRPFRGTWFWTCAPEAGTCRKQPTPPAHSPTSSTAPEHRGQGTPRTRDPGPTTGPGSGEDAMGSDRLSPKLSVDP